ncbi:MAG: hypothetical protein KJO07_01390, partial [Deltaproteobacteria bacterium]|nr:hypothetical protein [Deltaproteobacteria bacterium]
DYGLLFTARFSLGADDFWLGPQYPLSNNQVGLLFSRLSYGNGLADLVLDSGTAYSESGDANNGNFVGIRQPFPFGPGRYQIDLVRGETDGDGDWYQLSLTVVDTDEVIDIGRIRATRVTPGTVTEVPASIDNALDLYGYAVPPGLGDPPQRGNQDALYSDVPTWAWRLWYQVGDQDPNQVDTTYTVDDGGNDFANLEIQAAGDRVFLGLGADIGRCSPDGDLL